MNDDTPMSFKAAEPADPPSWSGPVKALQDADARHDSRLSSLETGFARLEQKTDVQTVMLGEIKGALAAAARDPRMRIAIALLFMAFTAWMAKHGFKLEMSP